MFPVTNFLTLYRQNKQNIPYLRVAILFENKQNYLMTIAALRSAVRGFTIGYDLYLKRGY